MYPPYAPIMYPPWGGNMFPPPPPNMFPYGGGYVFPPYTPNAFPPWGGYAFPHPSPNAFPPPPPPARRKGSRPRLFHICTRKEGKPPRAARFSAPYRHPMGNNAYLCAQRKNT